MSTVPHRGLITLSVMLASIMQALDNTIANVALPRIQGTLSATQDQMSWVLTSYIVAAAIMTPLSGWLAGRFGRRKIFLYLDPRFHARLGAVRPGADAAADRARASRAGVVRRSADPDVAGRRCSTSIRPSATAVR